MTGIALAGAAAGIAGSAISAGTQAAAGSASSKAARQAQEAQLQYLAKMYGLTQQQAKQMFGEMRGNLTPYMQQGLLGAQGEANMANQYAANLGKWAGQKQYEPYMRAIESGMTPYTMEEYQKSPGYTPMVRNLAELQATPGYQFELEQGQQALAQQAAARGGLLSGAQQRAAGNYAQKQAATGFQAAWERAQQAYQQAFQQRQSQAAMGAQGMQSRMGMNQQAAGMYAQGAGLYGNMANRGLNAASTLGQTGVNMAIGLGNIGAGYAGRGQEAMNTGLSGQLAGIGGMYGGVNQMAQGVIGAGKSIYDIYNRGNQADRDMRTVMGGR